MAFGALSLKGRALRCLAQREHSRAELERKLLRHAVAAATQAAARTAPCTGRRFADVRAGRIGPGSGSDMGSGRSSVGDADHDASDGADPDAAAAAGARQLRETLDELERLGLLSAARVADAELARHAPRYGAQRLRRTLQAKGLDAALVADTVDRSLATEYDRALSLWRRRYGSAPADAAERARQMRFLAGRGFSGDVIRRVLRAGGRDGSDVEDQDVGGD